MSCKGLAAFAVFLLSFFVWRQDKPASGTGHRSPPASLNFHSKKFRLEVNSIEDLLDEIENENLHRILLTVDKRTLQIVLLKMQGNGMSAIATVLWEDKVLTPSAHKISKGIGVAKVSENPYGWEPCMVSAILENAAYIGVTESFKSTRLGFKREMEREYIRRTTLQTA